MGLNLPSLKTIRELFYVPVPVPSFAGRKVLITGAASGIGRATAEAVAAQGGQLVLTDVQTGALDQVVAEINGRGGHILYHRPGEISDYEWVAAFAREVEAEVGVMDVVMNIAGVSAWGPVEKLEHRQWRRMVDVNLMGPIHIIECFVPPMVRRGDGGQLVNVSSAAGLLALPWHAAYSASKFGLRGISEVLRFDLRRHGIGVCLVCPGAVSTPLVDTVEISGLDRSNPVIQKQIGGFHRIAVTPEQAAQAICKGVLRNKFMVYTSFDTRFGFWWARKFALPYEIVMRIANNRFDQLARISEIGADPRDGSGSQPSVGSRKND
ncbi:putative oxidoreductase [Gordonia hirsuta DSM 44140 = NBRC 16056]|uniref:Putative oxidoreductase n=1 Tax=Gordonia hirsuta DSM 44140 = NBRC 16056 TaxID=1121927 RepID=L7L564_9ACTN|nr:SDR family oxidoreductase [Gordonia hirsuta]GAC56285.1 putative oxidoreductase [Gordonia hirsuta DSM 44140 = NBRC 16056]